MGCGDVVRLQGSMDRVSCSRFEIRMSSNVLKCKVIAVSRLKNAIQNQYFLDKSCLESVHYVKNL